MLYSIKITFSKKICLKYVKKKLCSKKMMFKNNKFRKKFHFRKNICQTKIMFEKINFE